MSWDMEMILWQETFNEEEIMDYQGSVVTTKDMLILLLIVLEGGTNQ